MNEYTQPAPGRWINCPCFGEPVPGTQFIAMKMPIEKCSHQIWEKHIFNFKIFQEEQLKHQRYIDAVISLANTVAFYNHKTDLCGVQWFHIPCAGHKQPPTKDEYKKFLNAVESLGNLPPNHYIAIHCTHGFNRTGFCIVRYLVDFRNVPLPRALELFAGARSPGIYKNDYIKILYDIYDLTDPLTIEKPDWEHPDPSILPRYLVQNNIVNETATLECVGRKVDKVTKYCLQYAINEICHSGNIHDDNFPGSNPVSLTRDKLTMIKNYRYTATYKSDGVRYFLFAYKKECYLIDRKFKINKVNVNLVTRKGEPMENTLIDGELVSIKDSDKPQFLIFDVLCFEDLNLCDNYWDTRMDYSKKGIVKFRELYFANHPEARDAEDFSIEEKRQWNMEDILDLEQYMNSDNLNHETDGIIVTPLDLPFVRGRCDQMLKMKPISLNSTDFMASWCNGVCYLSVTNFIMRGRDTRDRERENIPISILDFANEDLKNSVVDGTIIECVLSITEEDIRNDPNGCWFKVGWKPLRIRVDKETANIYTTFAGVFLSIEDTIDYKDIAKLYYNNK